MTNSEYVKKWRQENKKKCPKCPKMIGYYAKTCRGCSRDRVNWSMKTLSDVKGIRLYQTHSRIRELARNFYKKSNRPRCCFRCGYDKHYEVCHIKSVGSFEGDTSITYINRNENLIALCRNCHWELDNGFWEIPPVGIEPT